MSEQITVESFAEKWDRDHPLEPDCTASEWLDRMAKFQTAAAAAFPEVAQAMADFKRGFTKGPGITMDEWLRLP